MNAQELFTVVDPVQREAWPKGIGFDPSIDRWVDDLWKIVVNEECAVLMFEASMARSLEEAGRIVTTYKHSQTGKYHVKYDASERLQFAADSRVEAFALACRAIDAEGGKKG